MAVGAQTSDIRRLILGQGLRLILLGLAFGLALSLASTRFLRAILFGVASTDALTFISVALLLSLVALAACYLPARRATRVDPMVALRHE
jgi:putative ABC transport system permease protein